MCTTLKRTAAQRAGVLGETRCWTAAAGCTPCRLSVTPPATFRRTQRWKIVVRIFPLRECRECAGPALAPGARIESRGLAATVSSLTMKAQEIALAVAAIIVLTFVHQLVHESQKLVDLSQPLSHSKDEGRPKVREEDDPNFFVQQLVHESQKLVDLSQPLSHSKDEGRPKVHEELVQKYGSASTKEAEPNFLQRNLAISSFKLREVVVPGHWDTTLLVIAFNDAPCVGYYRAKGTMARLAEMYGQDWKHIAFYAGEPRIGGSHPEGTTCIIDTVPHGHQFIQMSNRNSEGAQLNHRFLLDAFERFPDFTGYFMCVSDGPT